MCGDLLNLGKQINEPERIDIDNLSLSHRVPKAVTKTVGVSGVVYLHFGLLCVFLNLQKIFISPL